MKHANEIHSITHTRACTQIHAHTHTFTKHTSACVPHCEGITALVATELMGKKKRFSEMLAKVCGVVRLLFI